MEQGDLLICVKAEPKLNSDFLVLGKIYEFYCYNSYEMLILKDIPGEYYHISRFKTLSEFRDEQISKILD